MLYQFLLDDVARKQVKPEQLKKGEEVEYIEDRQGNTNIKNKSHLIRTLSSKTPKQSPSIDSFRMHNIQRVLRDEDEPSSPVHNPEFSPVQTYGSTFEREPMSATSTDSKRLTM